MNESYRHPDPDFRASAAHDARSADLPASMVADIAQDALKASERFFYPSEDGQSIVAILRVTATGNPVAWIQTLENALEAVARHRLNSERGNGAIHSKAADDLARALAEAALLRAERIR